MRCISASSPGWVRPPRPASGRAGSQCAAQCGDDRSLWGVSKSVSARLEQRGIYTETGPPLNPKQLAVWAALRGRTVSYSGLRGGSKKKVVVRA